MCWIKTNKREKALRDEKVKIVKWQGWGLRFPPSASKKDLSDPSGGYCSWKSPDGVISDLNTKRNDEGWWKWKKPRTDTDTGENVFFCNGHLKNILVSPYKTTYAHSEVKLSFDSLYWYSCYWQSFFTHSWGEGQGVIGSCYLTCFTPQSFNSLCSTMRTSFSNEPASSHYSSSSLAVMHSKPSRTSSRRICLKWNH